MSERLTEESWRFKYERIAELHGKALERAATAEADLAAAREMGERECERAEHWFREWEAANADVQRLEAENARLKQELGRGT